MRKQEGKSSLYSLYLNYNSTAPRRIMIIKDPKVLLRLFKKVEQDLYQFKYKVKEIDL